MKRAGVLLILIILILSSFVLAQTDGSDSGTVDNIDDAYQCLEDLLDARDSEDLSLQEAIFSTLALGSDSKLRDAIEDFEGNDCWPDSSCTIKDTSQVILAYDRINKNTEDAESWLLEQNDTASDLTWFLQIDISNHISSTCSLTYEDETEKSVDIGEDMKVTGNPGSCFSVSASGFWLKVRETCYGETFQISCDEDFVTSLLYQRSGSSTVYVSPNTHSSSSSGTTEEIVDSQCFKTGSSCDYEGTLWATLALDKKGEDISAFIPYLLALAEDRGRFFPAAFLHILTSGDDQYSSVVQAQKQNQFWEAPGSPYNKFYDTALALLSLQGTAAPEFDNSINYLLDIQTPQGCWNNNNIRDTAFILYSGWEKSVPGDGGSTGSLELCEPAGFSCESTLSCIEAGGNILEQYSCSGLERCCSVSILDASCAEKGGTVCSTNHRCSGTTAPSADSPSCCLGFCEEIQRTTDCELAGGICSFSCDSNQEELTTESCNDISLTCCITPSTDGDGDGSPLTLWIIVLVIFIILVIIAIVFRQKLQVMFYKFKSKKRRPPAQGERRAPPPLGQPPPLRRAPVLRRPTQQPPPRRITTGRPKSEKDKELDDTLKKLREMSE